MGIMTEVGDLALMAAGAAGLTVPRIGIFTNDYTPNRGSIYTNFTLATYTGYANVTPTISAPFVAQPEDAVAVAASDAVFTGPTAGAGVAAYGWFLFDNGTHDVFAAGRFDGAPLSLLNPLDRISVVLEIQMGNAVQQTVNT